MSEERDRQEAARVAYRQQFGVAAPETPRSALPRHRPPGRAQSLNTPMPHNDPAYDEYILQKSGLDEEIRRRDRQKGIAPMGIENAEFHEKLQSRERSWF